LFSRVSIAATFVVVTNADSGPGSLRDALTQAAANGSGSPDLITFNIADVSTAGRTITLLSQMPTVSSNLTIDGTTQAGAAFGNSDARVKLWLSTYPNSADFTGLLVENSQNVAIYGLEIASIHTGSLTFGIRVRGSSFVKIGEKGKGNLLYGWGYDISNNSSFSSADYSYNISIKGNIMGLAEDGSNTSDFSNIDIFATYDIEIGGADPAEGNLMQGQYYCINISHMDPLSPGSFFARVINNKVDVDPTGSVAHTGAISQAVQLVGSNSIPSDTETIKTLVSNNIISGSEAHIQLAIQNIGHLVKVTGNRIGTNAAGTSQIGSAEVGIFVADCYKVLVGGDQPGDVNYIAGNDWGVGVRSPKVLVTKNSMFCNNFGIDIPFWSYPNPRPFVRITAYNPTAIKGVTIPFSRVELFDNQTCNSSCQGKTYINTVYADGGGNWSYTGPQTASMTVTATTPDSATSEFPRPTINTDKIKVSPATCGKNNGSITGIQILEGTDIKWVKDGVTVGTDTNLIGLAPGYYTLFVSYGANGCPATSQSHIDDVQPPATVNAYTYNTSCGLRNGQIVVSASMNGLTAKWLNALGDTIAFPSYGPLFNAGTYTLVLYPTSDNSCAKTYGPYTLTNQSGASIDISSAQITSASCRKANGSIRSVQVDNLTGTPYFRWVDANNVTVGHSADLLNVPAGQYRLKLKDQGPCDTAVSDFITISDAGLVRIDSTRRTTEATKCSSPTGGIYNITLSNGTSCQWIDVNSRATVGTSADLTLVPSGDYRLIATNTSGCTDSTGIYEVPTTSLFPLFAIYNNHSESCDRQDGMLSIETLNASVSDYTFRWTFSSTGQLVGTGTGVSGLKEGSYSLYATDANGCEQLVGKPYLGEAPGPQVSSVSISPDLCAQGNGSVILKAEGAAPFTYTWYDPGMQQLSTAATLNGLSAGRYSVVITDNNKCSTTASYSVGDSTITLEAPHYPSQIALKDASVQLVPDRGGAGTWSLFSDPPPGSPASQNTTGEFMVGPLTEDTTVYVTLATGACTSPVAAAEIKVVRTLTILMPNAFTPNGDGRNDIFRVKFPEVIKTFRMQVFDRWGRLVFAGEDPYRGWDGNSAGKPLPAGAYVWMIHYQDLFGNSKDLKGTVLLVR